MELYLDSADINEIKEAFKIGFFDGLTTTPTFMHRHGITDIDTTIVELSKIVPVLQIEALGDTADEIIAEAYRQEKLGLERSKTVYKVPISMEAAKACKVLTDENFMVNVHLVYTLQQAYIAMKAGATYVCPLVGRLQDQGHDALDLVAQCVDAVNHFGYNTKIMFSSVRNTEHIRNALNIGCHTVTAPWKVIKQLTINNLTTVGTTEFFKHTRLMSAKIKDVMNNKNPIISSDKKISDCLITMTSGGFGAVTIIDDKQKAIGIFTDGDLRRLLQEKGTDAINKPVKNLSLKPPFSIDGEAKLYEAQAAFKDNAVDELVVTLKGKVVGMLDVQDLLK